MPSSASTLVAAVAAALTVTLTGTLTGCGSQLDPSDVSRTAAGAGGSAGDGVQAGTDVVGDPATGTDDAGSYDPATGGDPSGTGETGAEVPGSGGGVVGADTSGGGSGGSGGSGGDPVGGPSGGGTEGPGGDPTDTASPGSGGGAPDAAPCDGFQNGPGVTDTTITIGNSSDISGPVPGIFEQAQDGARAFADYFNATTGGICGRTLVVKTYDSRTDAGADQQNYAAACNEVFAMVGSMSAFDSGGAAAAQGCGLPDIRSANVTKERSSCTTCFGAQSTAPGEVQNVAADYILDKHKAASQHAAFLFVNAGAAAQNAPLQAAAMGKRGLKFDYVQGIDTSEFNYGPYVQQLKDRGIEVVFWSGAASMSVRLRQTMAQQGYEPEVYMRDPTDYTKEYVETGGSAVDGTIVFVNFVPFEEASTNPELSLYLAYLNQVKPGAEPGYFGVFSWSAGRLFTDLALQLGGSLTRASLVAALRRTTMWTGHGITAPQHPGPHRTGECLRLIQLDGGRWKPLGGRTFECHGTTRA